MTKAQLLTLRNRLFLHDEIPEHDLDADLPPYYRPAPDEKAAVYLAERRRSLGGPLPRRVVRSKPLPPPDKTAFADLLAGSGRQSVSTTMAFARLLRIAGARSRRSGGGSSPSSPTRPAPSGSSR